MKLNSISFKARMIATGPIEEQEQISKALYDNAGKKLKVPCDWTYLTNNKDIYATNEEDVEILNKFQTDRSKAIMNKIRQIKTCAEENNLPVNRFVVARVTAAKFCMDNIQRIQTSKQYTTKQVLEAINQNLFDFVDLMIKKRA